MTTPKNITLFIQWIMLCLLVACRKEPQLTPITPSRPSVIVQSTTTSPPTNPPVVSLTPSPFITSPTPLTTPSPPVSKTPVPNALFPTEKPIEDIIINTSTPTLQFLPTFTPTATPEIFPTFVLIQEFSIYEALHHLYAGEGVFFSDDLGEASFVAIPDEGVSLQMSPCSTVRHSFKREKPFTNYNCVAVILAEPFEQTSTQKFLLLTQTIFCESHICAPYINGAVFSKLAGQWQLDFYDPEFLHAGSFGYAPPVQLVQIGPERYGVLFDGWYISSGLGVQNFYIATASNNQFEIIFYEQLALMSYEEDWGSEVIWAFIPGENPEWFDLQITLQGTRPKPQTQQIEQFVETRLYRWDGQRYSQVVK